MITVLGSINLDLVATAERHPTPGETVAGQDFTISPGGKGANQALAATRAGSNVRMVGAVGSDGFALTALDLLRQAGTDLSLVKTGSSTTGTAVILVDRTGENMITVIPGANGSVDASLAIEAVETMSPGDVLMLQLEIPATAVEQALVAARKKDVTTILNTAPFTAEAAGLASLADIVIANETEFDALTGSCSSDGAARADLLRRLHGASGQSFVVTLGKDDVIAICGGQLLRARSLRIQPVDTVGAGDTFCGYLAGGLDKGLMFPVAIERAAIAASVACLSKGAQPAIPAEKDLSTYCSKSER